MIRAISLINMNSGEIGRIVGFLVGHGMMRNPDGMGIRMSGKIKKLSRKFINGSVIIAPGNNRVA